MIRSALMAPAGSTLGSGLWADDPPTGNPSGLFTYFVSEDTGEVGLQWINGDLNSWTEIAYSTDGDPIAGETVMMVAPGVMRWDTGTTNVTGWYVRHTRGGTPGAWMGLGE